MDGCWKVLQVNKKQDKPYTMSVMDFNTVK